MNLSQARAELCAGRAMVVPNPPPLTFVITAATPAVVNTAKARPVDQPVAVWITTDAVWAELADALALDHPTAQVAYRLLVEERVTLLVPVRASHPGWLGPAVHNGHALLFGARWTPVHDLLAGTAPLYVSSANRTGQPPAATTAQACAIFAATLGVLDLPDPAPHARRDATTTIRIHPDHSLHITRTGAQDHAHGGPDHYLHHLHTTYLHP